MIKKIIKNNKLPLFWRELGGGLLFFLFPVLLSAQSNGVTVTNLVVSSGSPSTVTFDVSWKNTGMPPVWSDSVWVFVDYNEDGVMKRLPVTGATVSAGIMEKIPGNDQGVRVIGNARTAGNFSATIQLFSDTANISEACAYASNYLSVGEWKNDGSEVSFTGTPNYTIWLENIQSGAPSSVTSGKDFMVLPGYVITSFTDKTGAPGELKCISLTVYDLNVSEAELCASHSGVTFALSGTQPGRTYLLYKDGATLKATLPGTGGAATFSGTFNEPGVYTARTMEEIPYCTTTMNGAYHMVFKPAAPVIQKTNDVCLNSGNNIVFTASGYSGSLEWVSDGGGSVNGNTVTFNGSAIGTKTVVVRAAQTYTNAPTCYSAMDVQSASVNALPAAPVIQRSNDVCLNSGNNIVFTASGYSGSLEWVSDGGGSVNGTMVTFNSSVSGTKTVVARSALTYPNAPTCYSAEQTQSASVNALPAVASSSGASRCGSGAVTLSATASSGAVIDWYGATTGGNVLANGAATNQFTTTTISTYATYYAQARVPTTGCVSSARTAVTGSVTPPSGEGASPAPCGCASGLTNCGGRCEANCVAYTVCSGISYVTNKPTDGAGAWWEANAACTGKGNGWRLPNSAELKCLCAHKSSVAGGFPGSTDMWGTDIYDYKREYIATQDCKLKSHSEDHWKSYRCVK
jgi:uncharacterized membrane protein